jgi:peptidoglycan/LPS O-acetylase OafA/YrhL
VFVSTANSCLYLYSDFILNNTNTSKQIQKYSMIKEGHYFPNLNGIRCIAAMLVIIHHIEQFKSLFSIENFWGKSPFIEIVGHLGVVLFFVLSGFLITYLLLIEEKSTNDINIRDFYIRRVLRIWPLYYLIISISLFVLPYIPFFEIPGYPKDVVHENLALKIILYFTFFANIALNVGVVPYASQSWSIGIEEQFYLIWPVIIKKFKKYRILLIGLVIGIYYLIKLLLKSNLWDFQTEKTALYILWSGFTFDCMAIGSLFAILSFQKSRLLKIFLNNSLFYLSLATSSVLILMGYKFPKYHDQLFAILFGIIILNFATNKEIAITLENKILNYLGKISYGLYMFHSICIVIAIKICLHFSIQSNFILYPLCITLSILVSSFSYTYFEKRFLSIKKKYTNI